MQYTKKELKLKLKLSDAISRVLVSFSDLHYEDANKIAEEKSKEIINDVNLTTLAIAEADAWHQNKYKPE